jgi:hypothetical protein
MPISAAKRSEILAAKGTRSWREVADDYGVSKGMMWMVVNDDYEPKNPTARARLGMPALMAIGVATSEPVEGGAIIGVGSETCAADDCSVEFIPNHPRRRKCYLCSPVRKKEAS